MDPWRAGAGGDGVLSVLVPCERRAGERRVAATPETVRALVAAGLAPVVEAGAGEAAGYGDALYAEAGARLVDTDQLDWAGADVVLTVAPPAAEQVRQLRSGALLVGLLEPYDAAERLGLLSAGGVSAVAMELLPRISRAQSMDVLSSQANIAGYKAVLLAAAALDRYVPMLMTAAGTIQPARALVLGAGVAGLQAVATARRPAKRVATSAQVGSRGTRKNTAAARRLRSAACRAAASGSCRAWCSTAQPSCASAAAAAAFAFRPITYALRFVAHTSAASTSSSGSGSAIACAPPPAA